MIIKCWGSRGSIPVSGGQYVVYGGDTTCLEITAGSGETIIIDAGTGIRRLGNVLLAQQKKQYYMLFTHCHWDHIMGFPFFKPLLYTRNRLVIQDRKIGGLTTKQVITQVMSPPFFPVSPKDLKADISFDAALNNQFRIGSVEIDTIPTSHSRGSLGYTFTEDGKTFVFLTDNELGFSHPQGQGVDGYKRFAEHADVLFHDAEYTQTEYRLRKGWGHSSVPHALDLAVQAGAGQLGLIHLNQDRSDHDMDAIVQDCKDMLTAQKITLLCYGVSCDFEITL